MPIIHDFLFRIHRAYFSLTTSYPESLPLIFHKLASHRLYTLASHRLYTLASHRLYTLAVQYSCPYILVWHSFLVLRHAPCILLNPALSHCIVFFFRLSLNSPFLYTLTFQPYLAHTFPPFMFPSHSQARSPARSQQYHRRCSPARSPHQYRVCSPALSHRWFLPRSRALSQARLHQRNPAHSHRWCPRRSHRRCRHHSHQRCQVCSQALSQVVSLARNLQLSLVRSLL
jgi:hypothetical protein